MEISEELNKKIVVYTVIMGDYDYLRDPAFVMDNCDYICFTNNPNLKSSIWKIVLDNSEILDNTRWQRMHKVLAHKYLADYEWSVYVDGNVKIVGDLREYIRSESKGSAILCLKHPERDNIYSEADACLSFKKDSKEKIEAQIARYKKEGYMADNGLIVSNVLVRKHMDPEVIALMEDWWHEIENGSRRDQLSFNYVCWKRKFEYDCSELKPWKSDYWINPGIHTSDIENVEKELVEHIQQEDYYRFRISELERTLQDKVEYIRIKEQELKDANEYIAIKEQELKDANEYSDIKEQELEDANKYIGIKEQELKDSKDYIAIKEQELKDAKTYIGWKEQEIKDANTRLEWKEQEFKDVKVQISIKEQELQKALSCMSLREKIRRQLRKKS